MCKAQLHLRRNACYDNNTTQLFVYISSCELNLTGMITPHLISKNLKIFRLKGAVRDFWWQTVKYEPLSLP